MENNEEYLLRALRRTSGGLKDSLIPAHGAKLTKLLVKFESAESMAQEVKTLLHVQGFGKCSLAMEWLLERTKRSNEYVAPEQFESDVLLLNEKLFEAFLNQPFDMPDFSHTFEAPVRPVQKNIQISDDEFMGTVVTPQEHSQPIQQDQFQETFSEPDWSTAPATGSSQSMSESSSSDDSTPSLSDALNSELFESTERIAQTAIEFFDKQSSERPIAMAVLRVTIRAALDTAKSSGNVIGQDFYEAFLRLIAYADEQGKIRSDIFADVIRDTGDRLSAALKQSSGGLTVLKNITKYISDPKELFLKK